MRTRLLAAVVGLLIVLPILVWGGVVGLDLLLAAVMLVGVDEFATMAMPARKKDARALLAMYGVAVLGGQLYARNVGVPLLIGVLVLMVWSVLTVKDTVEGGRRAAEVVLGLVYVPFLLSFIGLLRRFDHGLAWIFLLLVITWFGDTGAYFAGRAFGKSKLLERVSPNKTREGAVGGMLLAIVGACIVKHLGLPRVSWAHAVVLGILLDGAGVLGDLFESMLKRTYDVKDSGTLMPGHGGILDRIDSLLFSAPVAWCYAKAFGLV